MKIQRTSSTRTHRIFLAFAMLPALNFAIGQSHSLSSASAQIIPDALWSDPVSGVSFRYPGVWKPVAKPEAKTPPYLFMENAHPRIDIEFSPAGNLYRHTNLVSLDFVYAAHPAASAKACSDSAYGSDDQAKPDRRTINGVTYTHVSQQDGEACHEITSELFSTFRNGTCHRFEEAFITVCPGVIDGTRGLTDRETRALQRHLDRIFQSVQFADVIPPGNAR